MILSCESCSPSAKRRDSTFLLSDDSRVLVDTDSERRTVSVATVKLWTDRFAIDVGWSVSPLTGEPSAAAQLNLYRSDGMNAP